MDKQMWSEICNDAAKRMISHLQPYFSPISRVLSEDEGEHLGSGAYFESEQKTFLITNEHVAKHLANNSLTHSYFQSEEILRLTNPAISKPYPVDVAISRIPESSWGMVEHSATAIPISRFANKHEPVKHELLFFAGYSGERARFLFGNLITRGTPYLTQECKFPTKIDEANLYFHFALFYPPELATSLDGTSHLPDPHGFSGSLVWDTKRVASYQRGEEWRPDMATVTGIVWGWPSSVSCILATKVEHLNLSELMNKAESNA